MLLFYKGLKEVGGEESKIHVVHGKIQISFFLGGAMAAKYTPEGEGLAGEGWNFKPDVTIPPETNSNDFGAISTNWSLFHKSPNFWLLFSEPVMLAVEN